MYILHFYLKYVILYKNSYKGNQKVKCTIYLRDPLTMHTATTSVRAVVFLFNSCYTYR